MKKIQREVVWILFLSLLITNAFAQNPYSIHFQQTTITQMKMRLNAKYSGANSLKTDAENQMSLTATFFGGIKAWKNAEIYVNPEISGGNGISSARGVAGFTNGEAFRIGDATPKLYLARGFLKQIIPLSQETQKVDEGINQVSAVYPTKYLNLIAGKFCLADYFDKNKFSHDPRTQFLNWSLMSNGAWDYPANVRGYTVGYVFEYLSSSINARISTTAVPRIANGADLDYDFRNNYSHTAEIDKSFRLNQQSGTIRLLGFYTHTHMGSYVEALQQPQVDITATRKNGRTKKGFGVNLEQNLNKNAGIFVRGSWNDGKNETWAFTEIDRSASFGFLTNGQKWSRPDDYVGIAVVANGISKQHQDYLANGGYGFIIGDGKLNYGLEKIFETYYSLHLHDKHFWITPNYQFVMNPGYNKDRGPANVYSLRVHTEF